ncbi:MAG: hypothetical protein RL757_2195 [Bacteroidota bacterium]
MSNHIVTQRFVKCHHQLRARKVIRSSRQFATELDYLPQSLSEILKGRRDVTIELLRKAIDTYRINPMYLFMGDGEMFFDAPADTPQYAVGNPDYELILHVPAAAQPAYVSSSETESFLQSLPTMTLPDYKYRTSLHRAFDVSGNVMEPTLFEGDKVVCSQLAAEHWATGLKNNYVYVLVTQSDLLIRRINVHRSDALLTEIEAISDNPLYENTVIPLTEIREIWYVRVKVSPFLPSPSRIEQLFLDDVQSLKQTVLGQSKLIEQLTVVMKDKK